MKKQFAMFVAAAFASVSLMQAQNATIPESPEQEVDVSQEEVIKEPAGAQPDAGVPPDVTLPPATPPDYQTAPVDPTTGATPEEDEVTVTVSQTFTNQANSITIVGKVDTVEEKNAVEQAVQQAVPNKQINNRLTVAGQEISEPAGAERPQDPAQEEFQQSPQQDEQPLDESSTPELDSDLERDFELQDESQP